MAREKNLDFATDLPKVDINCILQKLRGFHAPLLHCQDSHSLHTSFQFNHPSILVLGEGEN